METDQSVDERVADLIFGPEEEDQEPSEEGFLLPEESDEEIEAADEEVEETEESDEEEPQEPEVEFVEMEIDGKLYEIPVELKDYVLRQQDYTKKTQEVAQQRQQWELATETVEQQRKQFEFAESVRDEVLKAQQLEQTANQYQEFLKNNIGRDDFSLIDAERIRIAIDEARRERDEIVQNVQGKTQEFQQAQEQSRQELLNKGTEVLRSKIPGWGESQQKQVREFALAQGFTEQEINQVLDPRHVEVLWKASQYDTLQKGKTAAVKKAQAAPIKPKSRNPMPEDVKKKLNLRKKLKSKASDTDKADMIRENIADRLGL